MELSLLLAQNIFGLFLIIFVGYLTVKCRVLTPDDSKVISKVVLYIVTVLFMIETAPDR